MSDLLSLAMDSPLKISPLYIVAAPPVSLDKRDEVS
jgi:hypothetical protein